MAGGLTLFALLSLFLPGGDRLANGVQFRSSSISLHASDGSVRQHHAKTPPMGFNTWNAFGCNLDLLNEANIRRTVRLMNDTGLVAAGYDTFVIDDCWDVKDHRDERTHHLIPDPDRFPSGMDALGQFIKSMGMRFGMYADAGTKTCEQYPGSRGHEQIDADMFTEWGVDYLKVDGCFNPLNEMKEAYQDMSVALENTKRPIVFSCSWPAYAIDKRLTPADFDWNYLSTICDTWRLYFDTSPWWELIEKIMDFWGTWQDSLAPATKNGAWNDPDFLSAGHPNLSIDEAKSQIAVWSIIAAPLILSVNILNGVDPKKHEQPWLSQEIIDVLTNPEIIQMNQELPPRQGLRISNSNRRDIWARPMNDGSLSLVVVNRLDRNQMISISWKRLFEMLSTVNIEMTPLPSYEVRDLWLRRDLGFFRNGFKSSVPVLPHGCLALKLSAPGPGHSSPAEADTVVVGQ